MRRKEINRKKFSDRFLFFVSEGEKENKCVQWKTRTETVLQVSTDSRLRKKPMCIVSFGGIPLEVFAESGSPYSIINESAWKRNFVGKIGSQLLEPDISPEGFGGEKI